MNQENAFETFRNLPPVETIELIGLWKGRGIATGHPLDGILENLGWFGKRFTLDLRADALLFQSAERRLTALDPSRIPMGLVLRLNGFGKTRVASNLFSYLRQRLVAHGPVATLKPLELDGVTSAALVYDRKPIIDHLRRIDTDTMMGMMVMKGEERRYFFRLERVSDSAVDNQSGVEENAEGLEIQSW